MRKKPTQIYYIATQKIGPKTGVNVQVTPKELEVFRAYIINLHVMIENIGDSKNKFNVNVLLQEISLFKE